MSYVRVGDVVDYPSRFGGERRGTVVSVVEILPNMVRLQIQPEPVTNVAGQMFNRQGESVMARWVRKVDDLELLAAVY